MEILLFSIGLLVGIYSYRNPEKKTKKLNTWEKSQKKYNRFYGKDGWHY